MIKTIFILLFLAIFKSRITISVSAFCRHIMRPVIRNDTKRRENRRFELLFVGIFFPFFSSLRFLRQCGNGQSFARTHIVIIIMIFPRRLFICVLKSENKRKIKCVIKRESVLLHLRCVCYKREMHGRRRWRRHCMFWQTAIKCRISSGE